MDPELIEILKERVTPYLDELTISKGDDNEFKRAHTTRSSISGI